MNISDGTWASWCFKSPATPLFVQKFFRIRARTTSKLHITGYFCEGNPSMSSGSPYQMASNAEDVSIIRRRHDIVGISLVVSLIVPKLLLLHEEVSVARSSMVPGNTKGVQRQQRLTLKLKMIFIYLGHSCNQNDDLRKATCLSYG